MATPPTLFPKTSLFKNGESDSKAEASENKPGAQPAATGATEAHLAVQAQTAIRVFRRRTKPARIGFQNACPGR